MRKNNVKSTNLFTCFTVVRSFFLSSETFDFFLFLIEVLFLLSCYHESLLKAFQIHSFEVSVVILIF